MQANTRRFSGYARDRYFAPGVSEFSLAEIPDMSSCDPQSAYWVRNYSLNAMLRGSLQPPGNAFIFNYLRRAEGAFSEHGTAREATYAFLASEGQSLSGYASALLHWECFLGQSSKAYDVLRTFVGHLTGEGPIKFFERGDGSVEARLNLQYNAMKHVEKRIAAGQIDDGATVPVWLTNGGIKSTDALLTYAETGDILRDIARWANIVVDPRTMAEKLQADGATSVQETGSNADG